MVPSNPGAPGVPKGAARQGRWPGNLLRAQAQLLRSCRGGRAAALRKEAPSPQLAP